MLTVTMVESASFPLVSKAFACRLYVLFAAAGTVQSHVYGLFVTEQTRFELTRKSTRLIVMVPGVIEVVIGTVDLRVTLAPSLGLVIDTWGGLDAVTLIGTDADVAVIPDLSVAIAKRL